MDMTNESVATMNCKLLKFTICAYHGREAHNDGGGYGEPSDIAKIPVWMIIRLLLLLSVSTRL